MFVAIGLTACWQSCAHGADMSSTAKPAQEAPPLAGEEAKLDVSDADVKVLFDEGDFKLPRAVYLGWLQTAVNAVRTYYRQFPVEHLLVKLKSEAGDDVGFSTSTFEDGRGEIEIPIGENMSAKQLQASWVAAHEMTHLAFPIVGHRRRWAAEGQATYIEPIARLQVGDYTKEQMWGDLVKHLPSGLPQDTDTGLDGFHSIRRTYWGGALFFFLADLEIRKQTGNRYGLQDAVIGIVKAGGNAGSDWTVEKAFQAGDQSVHLNVLADLDAKMSTRPYTVDLMELWKNLGVSYQDGRIVFDDTARWTAIRHAIESGKP